MTTATTVAPLATAAAWYAKRGLQVLPCRPRGKIPASRHGTLDATCDLVTIGQWWHEHPDFNVAIATGRGVFVLDVDGPQGESSLWELERQYGRLPPTPESTTGRGRHLYFRHNKDVTIKNSAGKLGVGLDVRGEGGCVVAPPSNHPNGQRYRWSKDRRIDLVEIADAPDWLLAIVIKADKPPLPPLGNGLDRVSAYGRKALADELAAVASASVGQRNDQLNRSAFALGQLVGGELVERATVEPTLIGVAMAAGLAKAETERTVRSGIDAGMKVPRKPIDRASSVGATSNTGEPATHTPEKPTLDSAALHGFIGELIETIGPHTEADPVALIGQFFAAFGSAVGRSPHFTAEADRHGANLFLVLVAETAKGRKGTSWGHVRRLVTSADSSWAERIASGLSSGEGLIHTIRDPVEKLKPQKQNGRVVGHETEIEDPGIADKRLLAIEGEFASVLKVATREGSTLSAVIRNSWDGMALSTLTKNSPQRATEPHIAIIGHITREELNRYLTETEAGNGFGNRFLWLSVHRSKVLPEGGSPDRAAIQCLTDNLRDTIATVRIFGELRRDEEAREVWHAVYPDLSEGRPGLLGAMIARAEAQTMRLALLYALLDRSPVIRRVHLEAALALWSYAEQSARFIFADRLGDRVGDAIMTALRAAPDGLTRTEIYNLFGRHKSASSIEMRLATLRARGLARPDKCGTSGRAAETWKAAR